MPNIEKVDYEGIPAKAKQMRDIANSANTRLVNAYDSLTKMHDSWYGVRYNELCTSFNSLVPTLNEMLDIIVKQIPSDLEVVSNNYSKADKGTAVTTVDDTNARHILQITTKQDVGVRFMPDEVRTFHDSILNDFKIVVQQVDEINGIYKTVCWVSDAGTTFTNKLGQIRNNIVDQVNKIHNQFDSYLQEAEKDFPNADTANNV